MFLTYPDPDPQICNPKLWTWNGGQLITNPDPKFFPDIFVAVEKNILSNTVGTVQNEIIKIY